MNKNFFKEYELTYKAYVVLPAKLPINFAIQDDVSSLITKEIERIQKCIVAPIGVQLKETNNE